MAEKGQLKELACPPECGFMVRSHDEKEIIALAKQHAKNIHNEDMSDDELKKMVKNV